MIGLLINTQLVVVPQNLQFLLNKIKMIKSSIFCDFGLVLLASSNLCPQPHIKPQMIKILILNSAHQATVTWPKIFALSGKKQIGLSTYLKLLTKRLSYYYIPCRILLDLLSFLKFFYYFLSFFMFFYYYKYL